MKCKFETLFGDEIKPFVDDLIRLRLQVFAEFPYLYDGNRTTELEYVPYSVRSDAAMIVARDFNGQIIGVSTCAPLATDYEGFHPVFLDKGFALTEVFYFRESAILPAFRGQGIGEYFFAEREKIARAHKGIKYLSFMSVQRADNDPRMPADYHAPYSLWQRHGFEKRADMHLTFEWKRVNEPNKSDNEVCFWIKAL